jgi:hypothetical protein
MKIILPAILNPVSRRKDKSVKLSFETRELGSDEILSLMSLEGDEMWIALAPNQDQLPEIPTERAEIEEKTPSERLRAVLFVWYKQESEARKFIGTFESFKNEKMEKIIESIKSKLK